MLVNGNFLPAFVPEERIRMISDSTVCHRITGICFSLLVILAAGCASAPEPLELSEVQEISATITAVDYSRRRVSVRGPQGNDFTLDVGPEVRNLAQVQVGDTIRLSYEQAYVATLMDADEVSSSVPVTIGASRAELGERPGAAVGQEVTATVRIESVGPDGETVTFTGPAGRLEAIKIRRDEARTFARGLRPGDIVEITYSEALAIQVEPMSEQ